MSSDRYDGLTRRQWANRVTDFNPEFDKFLLIKHYTAKQLGKCMEGGNINLTKALNNNDWGQSEPVKFFWKKLEDTDIEDFY